jgi:PAS domain S-box-containing protein
MIATNFRLALREHLAVLSVSDTIEALLGYHPEDFLSGRVTFQDRIHPHDQDIADMLLAPDLKNASGTFNIRLRQANGRISCVKGVYSKSAGGEGSEIFLDLQLQDAKSLPRTLNDASMTANFRAMMENTDDYIYFKDRNHVFTGASQTLVSICDPAEHWADLLGQTDYDVFPEAFADIYYRLEKQVFAGTPVAHEVQETLTKDGRKGWVDNRKYPIRDEKGEIIGLYGIARDITEHKQMEAFLRASEERLRLALTAANQGWFDVDLASGEVRVSPEYARMFGYEPDEFHSNIPNWLNHIHPEDCNTVLETFHACIDDGAPRAMEYRRQTRAGGWKWIRSVGQVVQWDAEQRATRMIGIHTDIDQRKSIENYEKFRSHILEMLADNEALDKVLTAIVRGIEALHPAMLCSVLLLDEEGKHLVNGIAPSLPDFYNSAIDGSEIGFGAGSCGTAAFTGERVIVEDIATHPYWVPYKELAARAELGACWSQPIHSSAEQVLGTFAIYHRQAHTPTDADLAVIEQSAHLASIAIEQSQAAARLRESQRFVQNILDSVASEIAVIDPTGTIMAVNDAWRRFSIENSTKPGCMAPHADIGANYLISCNNRESRNAREGIQAVLDGHLPSFTLEYHCHSPQVQRWFLMTVTPLASGRKGAVTVHNNITARKQAELELRKHRDHLEDLITERTKDLLAAKDAAETANRAKSTFLANMSHELRTPMNAIMGMTDLVLHKVTDPKQRDQLSKVAHASQHLLAIINDVLDISKIEAERLNLEEKHFQLGEIIETLVSLVGLKAVDKGLQWQVDLPPKAANLLLIGDSLRLSQILLNLASNALKFTEQGAITVRTRIEEETPKNVLLHFEVQDTGIGIAAEDQKRLFNAFEQADGSMTRKYGGTGLGLAISKRLAEMMGGDIGLKSMLGQGSTFWFTVRIGKTTEVAKPAPVASAQPAEERLKGEFAGVRLLLVEDEPINQEIFRCLLEDVGLKVDLADDGVQAVEMVQHASYDLILMDMQMPKLNGIDATRLIRKLPGYARTPILAMTANAFSEDRLACLAAGMNEHITKPIEPELLYKSLVKWLAGSRNRVS